MRAGILGRIVPLAAMLFAFSAPASALSYSFATFDTGNCQPDCPSVIVAKGSISGREAEEFAWFIQHSGRNRALPKVLVISSPGGNAYGGLSLGHTLRKNGVMVIVAENDGSAITGAGGLRNGFCGSACVFVLAGGVKRIVPSGSKVAIHGSRAVQTEVHDRMKGTVEQIAIDRADVNRAFAAYYKQMGVHPELASLSEAIPNSEFRVLSTSELSKFRLATAD